MSSSASIRTLVRVVDWYRPGVLLDSALLAQRFRLGTAVLENPERTRQYLRHQIATLPYEVFGLLLLDTRARSRASSSSRTPPP
jgi:hypothetical protein